MIPYTYLKSYKTMHYVPKIQEACSEVYGANFSLKSWVIQLVKKFLTLLWVKGLLPYLQMPKTSSKSYGDL
jgi:hypothetical protein